MAHFAKLNGSVVEDVIVLNNNDVNNLPFPDSEPLGIAFCKSLYGDNTVWAQTSYNASFRYNYAGIGYTFDPTPAPNGAFILPKPYPSWLLNTSTYHWQAPVPYPNDGLLYYWDEETLSWQRAYTQWMPTADSTIQKLMQLAGVSSSDRFLDMGCGDGRVLAAAAALGASVSGVDIDPVRVAETNASVPSANASLGDLIAYDFSSASVIFLAQDANTILYMHPKLKASKAGTKFFYLPSVPMKFGSDTPTHVEDTVDGPLYMWVA